MRTIRTIAAVAATALVAVMATASPAFAADVDLGSFTVYPTDNGESSALGTRVTEDVGDVYDAAVEPAGADAREGSSAICAAYITAPHATPRSPRDGNIYVEAEAHVECSGTPSEIRVSTFMGYEVSSNYGSTSYRLHAGPGTSCANVRRCPRTGELVIPWGHSSRCYETGKYTVQAVVNFRYKYRGVWTQVQEVGPVTSGGYGRGC